MIYVTGDLLADIEIHKLGSVPFPEGKTLSKDDYVVILGDFGLMFEQRMTKTEEYWLNWLSEKPWQHCRSSLHPHLPAFIEIEAPTLWAFGEFHGEDRFRRSD